MLRTKQNLAFICFSHFHMLASKLSIKDKTACLKTWFPWGRRALFIISWRAPDLSHSSIQNLSFAKQSVLNSCGQKSVHRGDQRNRCPRLVYLRNDTPLYFSWQAANLSHSRFLDLSVGFAITLSKWEPEAVYGRTFTKTCQYPPIQQSAHSGSFPRFPKPVQRRLKTRQKLRILANLLIS